MIKLRKTRVALALAVAMGGGMATVPQAHAVNLAADGLGQVALVPYYTVRGGWDTYIHLTNTSDRTALLKIRFREAKNSREVRDFNIILSPYDMWVGAVTQTEDGSRAQVVTDDQSCTSPALGSVPGRPGFTGKDFTNITYDGVNFPGSFDFGGTGLDRTKEGYVEIFLMALSTVPEDQITSSNTVEYNSQHVDGVPRDCGLVDAAFSGSVGFGQGAFTSFESARNVIKASSTLINVADGRAVGVEPTMIANCQIDNIYEPGDESPDFNNCLNTDVVLLDDTSDDSTVQVIQDTGFIFGSDAISALLMRASLINEWTTAPATNASTDWVVTFPTKHFYTDGVLFPPFHEIFQTDTRVDANAGLPGRSCDPFTITEVDREEFRDVNVPGTDFSPRPPTGERASLCNEVNVVTFNGSQVLSSVPFVPADPAAGGVQVNLTTSVGSKGWASMDFEDDGFTQLVGDNIYNGLPVIGFGLTVRNNAIEAGNNRNYATAEDHSYRRDIVSQ